MKILLLTAADIDQSLTMAEAVKVNAEAYAQFSSGQAVTPQRIPIETPRGISLFKPAYLESSGTLALKVVSVFKENPAKGLPTINAVVMVFDAETGLPQALMDGTRLTALRTGAGAGAATEILAPEDAQTLALFGAGGMALDQARAVLAVRPIDHVRVYTPSRTSAEALAQKLKDENPGLTAFAAPSPAQALRNADVITCITTSRTPVFDPQDVKPGAHINGVGSFRPDMREVPAAGLADCRVFVDSLESARTEAGEIMQALDEKSLALDAITEIGQVILGNKPGRLSTDEITFFKSVGLAAQDAATARAVLDQAQALGLGRWIEL